MPRAIWWPYGGLLFLMSKVTLYAPNEMPARKGVNVHVSRDELPEV